MISLAVLFIIHAKRVVPASGQPHNYVLFIVSLLPSPHPSFLFLNSRSLSSLHPSRTSTFKTLRHGLAQWKHSVSCVYGARGTLHSGLFKQTRAAGCCEVNARTDGTSWLPSNCHRVGISREEEEDMSKRVREGKKYLPTKSLNVIFTCNQVNLFLFFFRFFLFSFHTHWNAALWSCTPKNP